MYSQAYLKSLVDNSIVNLSYNSEAERLIDPIKYILSVGGKRLRPVLALLACNLFTDKIEEAVMPATGIEIFHNFTLVHDDIMDQAPVRRNLPTVHHKWNVNQAILSGDVMAFIANECFLLTPSRCLVKVFREYNKAAVEVCTGQQLDIDFETSLIVTDREYLRMIELKTAVLIAASVKIGAIIGGADDQYSEFLYEFGRNLGLAFQIQDDLLDTYGDVKLFGKIPGGDIVANKKTFLSVKAFELAKGNSFKTLQDLFSDRESDPEKKIARVMEIYDEYNIRLITENLANEYIDKAFSMLGKIGIEQERKKELTSVASSLIGRVK